MRWRADGWALKSFFAGFYKFEPCEKGEYIYQIDLGDELYSVSDEYRELMGELGVEIVVLWGFWIILRKRAEDGPFELYTDVDSKIEHYRKIRRMFKVVTVIELLALFSEIYAGMTGNGVGWVFALLISLFVFTCADATLRTNKVIARLEEQKSGIEPEKKGGGYFAADHHIHRTSDQLLYGRGREICAADDKLSCPHFRCYHDGRRYRAHGKGREMNSYRWTAAGGSV